MITFHRAHLNSARCGADLSNGSERSLYVPMSYIFKKLGRPHRAINIMFTYYPFDKGWPKRSSELVKWKKGMDLWDLPYDDYIPFTGIVDKDQHAESIKQFRDIRRFGQDIHFTLTIDPKTPKKTLRKIAEGLKPYGRVFFRINHECNGFWFQHNKRYSYKTVSDFFIEFHNIIKEKAPLVKTVFCLNGTLEKEELHLGNDELAGAVRVADIIGLDRYLSLNYGWPSPWKKNSTQYFNDNVDEWWSILKFCYKSIRDVRKHDFPMTLPETNADAEVNGPYGQAKRIQQMYEMIRNEKEMHIGAVTLYQFRDRGGLGLEKENPKTKKIAGTCPSISAYRKATSDPFYNPVIKTDSLQLNPERKSTFKWIHSENAEGLTIRGTRPSNSRSIKLITEKSDFLVCCNNKWFHINNKNMLILDRSVKPGEKFKATLFFPPPDGLNSIAPNGGYADYYEHRLTQTPKIIY